MTGVFQLGVAAVIIIVVVMYLTLSCDNNKALDAGQRMGPYTKTVVFIVCLCVVSVASLALSFVEGMMRFRFLLLTVQAGLLVVIIATVLMVHLSRRAAEKAAQFSMDGPVASCPDFWTRNGADCVNAYVTPDGKYRYAFGGSTTKSINTTVDEACAAERKAVRAKAADYPWTYLRPRCGLFS